MSAQKSNELSDLLERLDKQSSDLWKRVVLEGHPVSRDDGNLHLAIASGLVAIPVTEIEGVRTIFGRSEAVEVVVRNSDHIQYLRRAEDFVQDADVAAVDAESNVVQRAMSCGDTATRTSAQGCDATDDYCCRPV
ncbi:hypothetical protein [Saccharopolyspora spinosa]|uniref:Uncharacterized protein n=1 Tax=Saccharopolyspora spinosa TaxID=60894 RepID=A0A2N3Y4D9_SACSN|nr:hypothetical protein [Saccharopolyspora spinosa]PKW17764.1 hypothetical protein A8926_5778 [Saccharopolyspora spinosa]